MFSVNTARIPEAPFFPNLPGRLDRYPYGETSAVDANRSGDPRNGVTSIPEDPAWTNATDPRMVSAGSEVTP